MIKRFIIKFIFLSLFFYHGNSFSSDDFNIWLKNIKKEALNNGISEITFEKSTKGLVKPNEKVLKYYNNQPEFKISFNKYYERNINKKRIITGKKLLLENKIILDKISEEYIVPSEIIVSIWGIETNYGSYTGNFNVIDSLATLAFGSNRKEFFKREFFNSLLIIEKKYINATNMKGSWAGAMGQSQFMPSSFLQYAIDYNMDGTIDLWKDKQDIFASIGNYLKLNGWKENEKWSYELFKKKNQVENIFSEKNNYSKEFLQNNFKNNKIVNSLVGNNYKLKIITNNPYKRYFIEFKNFKTIKKYNNSDYYALVIGALANRIIEK